MMDSEQGRCRRTDGKKWRCYKAVVPDQKYCESHMHRGSKRSRKLVETKKNTPVFLTRKSQSTTPGLTTTSAKRAEKVKSNDAGKHNMVVKERIAAVEMAFSPKSVLQDGQSCSEVEYPAKNPQQTFSRCLRTDGRKWQCNIQALPAHKCCAQHVNRGLKKPVMSLLTTKEAKRLHLVSSTTKLSKPGKTEIGIGLDTNLDTLLSMSLPDPRSNFRVTACDSSTTETTISDDCGNISESGLV